MRHPSKFFLATPTFLFALLAADLSVAAPCTQIKTLKQLQAIEDDLSGSYCLMNDIDATGKAFHPIGSIFAPFMGSFDGRGHIISNLKITTTENRAGLFAALSDARVRSLTLRNVRVSTDGVNGAAGGVAGVVNASSRFALIKDVHVSGAVSCTSAMCVAGGITGGLSGAPPIEARIENSSSSARVRATGIAAGVSGSMWDGIIRRSYSTGDIACTATDCMAAGLAGRITAATTLIDQCFAAGTVSFADGTDSRAAGLVAYTESGAVVRRSYAIARVAGGTSRYVAGLIAQHNSGADLDQIYAAGFTSTTVGTAAGLIATIGFSGSPPEITNAYWDTETTVQPTSNAGTGLTTSQIRTVLPIGFGSAWGITKDESYPFLVNAGLDFVSPLATLVRSTSVYTFLPISQLDLSQYKGSPKHAARASLAVTYTMIARAIGITKDIAKLRGTKVDVFWNDDKRRARWKGPVKDHATLGPQKSLKGKPLNGANVIGAMVLENLVLLHGTYKDSGGAERGHWLLGTLFTRDEADVPNAVFANDPFTGRQVRIDPKTKRVVAPVAFPLNNFKLDAYRIVTIN